MPEGPSPGGPVVHKYFIEGSGRCGHGPSGFLVNFVGGDCSLIPEGPSPGGSVMHKYFIEGSGPCGRGPSGVFANFVDDDCSLFRRARLLAGR